MTYQTLEFWVAYLIRIDDETIKIGITTNLDQRMRTLARKWGKAEIKPLAIRELGMLIQDDAELDERILRKSFRKAYGCVSMGNDYLIGNFNMDKIVKRFLKIKL